MAHRSRRALCGDVAAVLITLLLAGLCLLPSGGDASVATVRSPSGVITLPLAAAQTVTVTGNHGITLTVQAENGRVRVSDAGCPDKLCVKAGWLSSPGQTAVCVPAGVVVRVGGEGAPDVVSR